MKRFLLLSFVLSSVFGFAQQLTPKPQQTQPLFLTTTVGHFDDVYQRLNVMTENITDTNFRIKRIDEIRQGQLIVSTENIGKSLENIKIDTQPSLDVHLQRIMFTGTFRNPKQRNFLGPIKIK